MPSSRTKNTRKIENASMKKKFEVAGAAGLGAEVGVPEDEAEALLELDQHARLRLSVRRTRGRLLGLADAEEEEAGGEEADRVDEHRVRRGEELDEAAARPGPQICAVERLISSFELPSMICSRSTSEGRYDW